LARRAAEGPQSYAIALNAANEVAVQAFLDELIGFADIPIVNETVLDDTADAEPATIDEVLTIDAGARESALRLIEQIKCERDRPGRRENA
jgi:1-deoxy-D-xylulose-5-phosphate reductoisomerase